MDLIITYLGNLLSGDTATWFCTAWAAGSIALGYFMVECKQG